MVQEKIDYTFDGEERAKIVRKREAARVFEYTKALVKRFGPEVLDVLGETSRELTMKGTEKVLEELNIEERDAIAAVKVISYFHAITGTSGEVVEATPHRAVRIERACPCSDLWDHEFCSKVTSVPAIEGMCAAINPKLTFTHPKFLNRGDDRCEMVFELNKK
ncbi:MAG: hypothetical protein ISS66_21675 [Desulfobacteraceae bacterium]|nr:hypothetical protein [Desulfobacteraceae bacterium]